MTLLEISRNSLTRSAWSFVSAIIVGSCIGWVLASRAANQGDAPRENTIENIFQDTNLLRLSISIPEDGMQNLRRSQPTRDHLLTKPKALAMVMEGNRIYSNVTVQVKGYSSFRPIDDLPALTLNFGNSAPKQPFHGLTKISLNNSTQDGTRLHEKFSRELFTAAGVPVPQADYAVVTLNGRGLGVYVLVEGYGKEFLKRHFQRADGNLYEGGVLQDLDSPVRIAAGDPSKNDASIERLITATKEPDPERRFHALEAVLDMDRFLSMVAMETILCHSDSYSMNRNNYWMYHDPSTDKIVFMPHGMDRVLGTHRSPIDLGIVPPMLGMIARATLSTPEGRQRYLERAGTLFTNLFQPERLCQRVREINSKISAEMTHRLADRSRFDRLVRSQADGAEDLCRRIWLRAGNLQHQFAQPPARFAPAPIPAFGPDKSSPLGLWKPKLKTGRTAVSCQAVLRDGRQVLRVIGSQGDLKSVPQGPMNATLSSSVSLPAGRYRLTGQVIVARAGNHQPVSGVLMTVLRYNAYRFAPELYPLNPGDINFIITVQSSRSPEEIEFLCDVRDDTGEVWFDASLLRLIKQP